VRDRSTKSNHKDTTPIGGQAMVECKIVFINTKITKITKIGFIMEFDLLSNKVLGSAIEVHKHLGPGLLESTYKQCLAHELYLADLKFELEVNLPIKYKTVNISCAFRIDMIIENQLILELKNVEKLMPVHEAQILTYMRLSQINIGLLINFNERYLKNGIKRYVL
jgi:GxxExxY protein